jgi:transcription antitermination factor NusG
MMSLPLFPGYVFVKMLITERVMVLRHPGAIRLVGFNGNATALPDGEVEALRSSLEVHRAEPYPFLTPGKQVQLRSGPLAGLQGTILRRKGKTRLIITLNLIQRAVSFEMDAAEALLTA